MSYSVHNFITGETIEAAPVNEMDQQIQTNESNIAEKASSNNPVFTGSISLGRKVNTTIGNNSVAEGNSATASGMYSHAEGNSPTASGNMSHAEGFQTIASGGNSHSEGDKTTASGGDSHAEGFTTIASATAAHAEGGHTTASGMYSHAEGEYTVASKKDQHVFGSYNIEDPSVVAINTKGVYVEIVGNGTGQNARSNARTLDWNGNEELAGDLTVNKGTANELTVSGLKTDIDNLQTDLNTKADKANPRITGSLAFDGSNNEATGSNSVALGGYTKASGTRSFALGAMSEARATNSIAVGNEAIATSGADSFATGRKTVAIGSYSYTGGIGTVATWGAQHVFGEYNVPDRFNYSNEWAPNTNYVVGYSVHRMINGEKIYYVCIADHTSGSTFSDNYWAQCGNYIYYYEIVGNGTSNTDRSNARVLDRYGNERLKGDLYVGCNADSSGGTKAAKITDIPEIATAADVQLIITKYEEENT